MRFSSSKSRAKHTQVSIQRSQTWLSRPIARCSDKVSAIFAKPAASEIAVIQFPSLVKVIAALRAWQATYSWPFKITWAGKGGMAADLDGEMAPVGVEDMKRVVVDIEPAPAKAGGIGFLRSMWCLALTSHTGACARPTRTRNKPWVTVVLARYSSASSCLRCPAEQSITSMPCALA